MKKQYLISLLGFFAIFIPFGSGLVNTNLNSSNNEKTTGITMKETSKIFVIDKDNSNDVTTSDTINSIYFEGEWMFENWGGKENYDVDDPSEEGLNLYSSQWSDEPILEVSYKTLKNKGTSNLSEDSEILTYSIEANSLNNENVGIWGYQIGYKETFEITADYNSAKEPKIIKEDNLGIIELVLFDDPSKIEKTSNVEVTITPLTAEVDYKVIPGSDSSGNLETVEFVRWMNGSQELASSEKEEDTLLATSPQLEPNVSYNNTTLIAKMSGGWTEEVEVESFDTIFKNIPSTIEKNGNANVTSSTEANVSYNVIPGKDSNGKDVTVEEVKWMDGDEVLAIDKVDEGNGIDGILYATKLKANSLYEDTTIIAHMSDESSTNSVKIKKFKTSTGKTPSTIEEVGTVNVTGPNTATVGYEIIPGTDKDGNLLTVEKVVWIEGWSTDAKPELAKDVKNEGNGIDGVLETDKLKSSKEYSNTSIQAKMSDGTKTNLVEIETFKAGQDISTIEQVNDVKVTSYNSASVNYKINIGENVDGDKVKIKKVIWIEGSITLDSLESETGLDKTGTLKTSSLEGNLSHDTILKAQMSDNSWIETSVNSFETPACNDYSTIEKVGDINVTSSTEANISYIVDPGKDVYGHPVTVKKVKWMEGEEELATSTETSGTLEAIDLNPNQTYYNTYIIADMSANETTNSVLVGTFQAKPGNKPSRIKEVGGVNVTSSTEANVGYTVTPGKNVWGDPVTVEKVEWKNGNDVLATDEVNTGNEIDGTLETDKLSPNQSYDNTKIIATMSDGVPTRPVKLETFQAKPGNKPSRIKEVGGVNVTSSTEANVGYTVTPGKNVWGDPVTVEKVEWKNGDEVLATDEVNTENEIDGTLETDKLSPNQSYDNTKIIATMSDGIPTRSVKLETFQAKPGNKPSRIKEIGGVNVTSSTEANVGYTVTPGKDVWGNPVTVEKVEWKNGDEVLATDEVNTENEIDGTLETDKLSPNQSYDNTKIIATMSDGIPTRPVKLESFQANASLPTNEATAINIDEGNGILQVEGKITKNEATIKEINLIDIEANESVTTKYEIIDGSYSVFTDQYNGNIDNYRLQVSYEIDGKTSNLENEYKDIQNSENITEYIDLSYLIDTDDLKLGWIIAGSLIVLILCIIAVGFFVF